MSRTHSVTFSRLRASFQVDKESLIGKADPYVLFNSGSSRVQTKAIKGVGASSCEWKESYTLEEFSPSTSSVIEVTVYNHNTLLPDSTIGSGTVDLANQGESSLSGQGEPVSVVLTDKKGSEVGTLQFVVNGGGYTGRGGASGTRSGTGVGTGSGVGTGAAAAGVGAGAGAGSVVGRGTGTDQRTAQQASDKAAAQGREVTIEERGRVGVGHPEYSSGTGSNTGSTTTGTRGVTGATGITGVGSTDAERAAIYGQREGDVIDRKYYVGTESRPQDQALVEQYREHNPYAKDYETTVQHTGRERLVNSQIEALGTRERVIGQDHHVHAHPHEEIARNLPASGANIPGVGSDAGAVSERPGGEGWVQTKVGPVCDTNTFSITGNRTVDKERVTDLREHRDFEKEFEVKTRLVGERALDRGTEAEILNRERVLVDEKNKIACEGHPPASAQGGQTLASQGAGTGYGSTGTGVGSQGYGSTGTGVGSTGAGYGSQTGTGYGSQTGTGYGSNTGTGTGAGYGSSGTGKPSMAERAAGYVPGTEENQDKKQGYQPGQGPQQNSGNVTAGEKAASYVPGTQENREKKTAQYN